MEVVCRLSSERWTGQSTRQSASATAGGRVTWRWQDVPHARERRQTVTAVDLSVRWQRQRGQVGGTTRTSTDVVLGWRCRPGDCGRVHPGRDHGPSRGPAGTLSRWLADPRRPGLAQPAGRTHPWAATVRRSALPAGGAAKTRRRQTPTWTEGASVSHRHRQHCHARRSAQSP